METPRWIWLVVATVLLVPGTTLAGRNGAPLGAALLGYTDVYTLTDEVVVPNFGPAGLLRHRKLP
jgi:hypothetical protein